VPSCPYNEGVKNRTATAISHVWQNNTILHKPKIHVINISITEIEIMSMYLGLEQALEKEGVKKITLITDTIHGAQKIFDTSCHLF